MGKIKEMQEDWEPLDLLDPARWREGDVKESLDRHFIGSELLGVSAADAAEEAAREAQQAEREKLAYQKQAEALPRQFRDISMQQYGALFGLEGVDVPMLDAFGNIVKDDQGNPVMMPQKSGEEVLAGLQASPIYQGVMSGMDASEEAILRNQAMTGGFRSGGTQQGLARNAQQLQNEALMQSMSGLQQFTRLPTNTQNIANTMGNIGMIGSQGQVAAANARAQGMQNTAGLGLTGLGIAGELGWISAFSDASLKENIHQTGKVNGHNWYTWDWNEKAAEFGLSGKGQGVLAQEVEQYAPDAVSEQDGFKVIDYAALGVLNG
jgi:hypothetical protein